MYINHIQYCYLRHILNTSGAVNVKKRDIIAHGMENQIETFPGYSC